MLSKFFTFLAFFIVCAPYFLKATNYFFSSTIGDDSRNSMTAQYPNTPWKTIDRLNAFFSSLKPGDSVFFKRGDTFQGTIRITKSGSLSFPIVFTAYGSGPMPVVSGLISLSSWRETSGGIYKTGYALHSPVLKMLLLNRIQQPLGREPNAGYLTYKSHVNNLSIIGDQSKKPGWQGAQVVIRKNRWIIDKGEIISIKGDTIEYSGGSKNLPTDGYGYFIQNDLRTLDKPGEWFFDLSKKEVYVFFGNKKPGDFKVDVSDRDFLVIINHQRFLKFENLSFEGPGVSCFKILNSPYVWIRHCNIDLSAADAIDASGSSYLNIEYCQIDHSLNDAINLDMGCRFATLRYNLIRNTGLLPGMGESGTGSYQAVSIFGDNSMAEFNEIDSTGYNAVYFGGNSTTVKNNRIDYFCTVKDDGAAIYVGDWNVTRQKKITGNIIFNGIGASLGTKSFNTSSQAEGIYIDDNSSGVEIQGNSISKCPDGGIKIHNAHDVYIEGNTLFDNGNQLLIAEDTFSSHSPVRNIVSRKNIFFCKSSGQLCLNMISTADDLDSFVSMEDNIYFRPKGNNVAITLVSKIWSTSSTTSNFSLSEWQEKHRQEKRSKQILASDLPQPEVYFECNSSQAARTISLKGTYVTPGELTRSNTFKLEPYHSVLLIKDL
ncbi:MAG: hypothetical protein C5B59_14310 [Bacteroidetes bacterium]|nr:MAG: hypothetical protein C5B59_14310 [Bacteroidota bacterium]